MPSVKLTKRTVESWPIGDKPVELWDTVQKGFLCKITPAGSRVFMLAYRSADGVKHKPRIGLFGSITVEKARQAAEDMMATVVKGGNPSADRKALRRALTVAGLCDRFLTDYVEPRAKPRYQKEQKRLISSRIKPAMGSKKVAAITTSDVAELHTNLSKTPTEANRTLALLSVMFTQAEVWKLRPEGSNPTRLVKRYKEKRRERLLTDAEVQRIYDALAEAEESKTELDSAILAIRLLFSTACRAGEILGLQWSFVKQEAGDIVWPDTKTGSVSKPLTEATKELLKGAERVVGNPFVCVGMGRSKSLSMSALEKMWSRILKTAKVPHCGLHAIRHRAATDIANSGVPIQVGMKLTGHKTAQMYLRYLHTDADQIRAAAEAVSKARAQLVGQKRAGGVVSLKERQKSA